MKLNKAIDIVEELDNNILCFNGIFKLKHRIIIEFYLKHDASVSRIFIKKDLKKYAKELLKKKKLRSRVCNIW